MVIIMQAAVKGKQQVKRFDNEINAQLMETLFNVEPVLLLDGQPREARAFDRCLFDNHIHFGNHISKSHVDANINICFLWGVAEW